MRYYKSDTRGIEVLSFQRFFASDEGGSFNLEEELAGWGIADPSHYAVAPGGESIDGVGVTSDPHCAQHLIIYS